METQYVDGRAWLYDSWNLPGDKEMGAVFMGDFQWNPLHPEDTDSRRIGTWANWAKGHNFPVWFTGDELDVGSPSSMKELNVAFARAYGSNRDAMDLGVKTACDNFAEGTLAPLQGILQGGVGGHHNYFFSNGMSATQYLVEKLGGKYLGDCGAIVIDFGGGMTYKIFLHHGPLSVAATVGAVLGRVQRIAANAMFDLYVVGHFSQNLATKIPKLEYKLRGKKIVDVGETRRLVTVGSAMRGYIIGRKNALKYPEGTYAERFMLAPISLGWGYALIRPKPKERRVDSSWSL